MGMVGCSSPQHKSLQQEWGLWKFCGGACGWGDQVGTGWIRGVSYRALERETQDGRGWRFSSRDLGTFVGRKNVEDCNGVEV